MGLMDKMKAAAQDVATGAAKATEKGKSKVEEVQLKRKQDEAAKQLGYLVHAQRTEGGAVSGEDIDRLVFEISSLQTQITTLAAGGIS
jgi:hypothetical protein